MGKGHLAALAAAGALLLAGCGSDDGDDAQAVPADGATAVVEEQSEGRQLSVAELEGALLTLDDLPSGYAKEPSEDEEDDDSKTTADNPECQKIFDDLEAKSDDTNSPQAEVTYSQGSFGPMVEHVVKSYEGNEAAEGIERIRAALEECPTWTETGEDGTESKITTSEMSFPDLGDETYAVRMSSEVEGLEFVVNVVMTRVDRNLSLLSYGGLMVDGSETEELARTATEKLERASV